MHFYDFWYQIKGVEYLGPHVLIFCLRHLGIMPNGIQKSEILDISLSKVSLLLQLL